MTSTRFDEFLAELAANAPAMKYVWNTQKETSCDWIISRISQGTGIDVGGTPYLLKKLKEKGCDMRILDQFVPENNVDYIQDDMMNILAHFEDRSLDFITTRHTLEHSVVPLFQLWAYNKILRPGGKLFVIVPRHVTDWIWFGTHHNCLPIENWFMLFYRAGFHVGTHESGTWRAGNPKFTEWRFELIKETETLRLENCPKHVYEHRLRKKQEKPPVPTTP
jgi:SAM-dependent methyltransferase